LTKNNLYYLGKLGKPHGLLGFQYINIDKFFRDLDLSNVNILIGQKEYKIDNFKKHLKDRNLIKFENIDSVYESESLRDNEVFISSEYKYLTNKSNLPWPKFFIGYEFSSNVKLVNYFYSSNLIMCTISNDKDDIVVSYDDDNFKYVENTLYLTID